jgi:hypothetical protein
MTRAVLVLLLWILPTIVSAQTFGFVMLASGNKHFPCATVLKFYATKLTEIYHATLWAGFGKDNTCNKKIFALPKPVTMEFYLSNEACRRKGNCEAVDLLPWLNISAYNKALEDGTARRPVKKRASEILAFCRQNKKEGDKCILSLGLESNYTKGAAQNVSKYVRAAGWKRGDLAYTPTWGCLDPSIAYFHEHHGLYIDEDVPARRSIISVDGNTLDFCKQDGKSNYDKISSTELRNWLKQSRVGYFAGWCPMWQGSGQSGSRLQRTYTIPRIELSEFLEIWRSAK